METNYEELLRDVVPSKKVIPYLMKKKLMHRTVYRAEYVTDPLTKKKKKMVRCICSGCGESYLMDYAQVRGGCGWNRPPAPFGFRGIGGNLVISRGDHRCPCCEEETKALHIGEFGGCEKIVISYHYIQEIRKIKGVLALLQWIYRKEVNKEGVESFSWDRYNAFVVEERKIVRLSGFRKVLSSYRALPYFEQRKKYLDEYGRITDLLPWDRRILNGTPVENSKLDIYLKQKNSSLYPVSYLRLYLKHKNVENLMTCGTGSMVAKMIENGWVGDNYQTAIPRMEMINWKRVKPAEMLGIDKVTLRRAINEKWDEDTLRAYKWGKDEGIELSKEELKDAVDFNIMDFKEYIKTLNLPLRRLIRYLKKQNQNLYYLRDYYEMAKACGHDMSDMQVLWPKDLRVAHDRVIEMKKVAELKEFHEAFKNRAEKLEKFAWEKDGILIRPVSDEKDLVKEGDVLHHCVANYAKRNCEAKCAIFLIRRKEAPDEPWFTLNLNEKDLTVTENRGFRNCSRTKEIETFEAAWLGHIRNLKKSKKEKVA